MNRKDFITKMLELGSQLELSCSGIEANMIINDAEILHDKYFEQKQATKPLETEASDICHSITDSCSEQYHILCVNMGCGKCDKCGAKLSESLLNCR